MARELTVRDLDVAPGEPSKAEMDVPRSGGGLLSGSVGGVPFHDDRTGSHGSIKKACKSSYNASKTMTVPSGSTTGGEDQVREFHDTLVTRLSDY